MVRTPKGVFINVVFSREVEIEEPEAFVGVDLNENNVALSLSNGEFLQITTHEREIRTGYFVKRRKIQKKIRLAKGGRNSSKNMTRERRTVERFIPQAGRKIRGHCSGGLDGN